MAFDFDRAAHIMACLSAKPVSPKSLNPYRAGEIIEYDVDDIERSHRIHIKGGRHIEQVVPMDRIINDD